MSARRSNEDREQGKTAHGHSLAQKLRWLHALAFLAACGDVDPLHLAPRDPDDVDADSVANAVDNCPEVYNDDQHDEDGDGFGDRCDVCPTVVDDQADLGEQGALGLGDGIGDACDPRPSRDGDVLERLDVFTSADTAARYGGTGWAIGGGVARTVSDARWVNLDNLQGDGLRAQIRVSLLVWLRGGFVEVGVDGDGVDAGATCVLRHTGGEFDELIATEIGGATMSMQIPPVEAPFTLKAGRILSLDRTARLRCILDDLELILPLALSIESGTFEIASSGAITDLDSLAVYTFPINPCVTVGPSQLRLCDGDNSD